jgi:hypothetical protein
MNRTFVLRELVHLASLIAFLTDNWKAFADEGRFLAVTVSFYKSKRSREQNKRYFGPILSAIVEQVVVDGRRYGKREWHHYFKGKFIGFVELPFGGLTPMSSKNLDVEEFSTFMQEVEAHAATELGVRFS